MVMAPSPLSCSFSSKEQVSVNFMAVVTICSLQIFEPPKIKSLTVSIVSPSICHEVMGLDAMMLVNQAGHMDHSLV